MCDNDSMDDMIEYQLKSAQMSRRRFGAFTLGAGVISMLPAAASAGWIEESEVEIESGTQVASRDPPWRTATPPV